MTEIVDITEYDDTSEIHESLGDLPREYRKFQNGEGIPVHKGLYFEDIHALETEPWDRTGEKGAFVNLDGANGVVDLHIHDLTPGGKTDLQNHLYEEIVYVAEGEGFTAFGEDEETVFEWKKHSLFYIPPNTPYRHINGSDEEVRLISQTPLPQLMNIVDREELLFGLESEWNPDDEYYSSDGDLFELEGRPGFFGWDANFIPDVSEFEQVRDEPTTGAYLSAKVMLESSMRGHVAELPPKLYKTAHRHAPGATIFWLSGEGYALMWREGWDEKLKIDWGPNTVFSPPARWYHQFFNVGSEPAQHFAGHWPRLGTMDMPNNPVFNQFHPENVIEYVDEDPLIRERFRAELEKRGIESEMPDECFTDPDYSFSVQ